MRRRKLETMRALKALPSTFVGHAVNHNPGARHDGSGLGVGNSNVSDDGRVAVENPVELIVCFSIVY
jgi:hypothetical protein